MRRAESPKEAEGAEWGAVSDTGATPLPAQSLLFSVIVPLQEHRGQWQQCIRAWHAQTVLGSQFELIIVVPPGFSAAARSMLHALLRAQDRIEYTEKSHDIALCAVGAKLALGQF